MSEKPKQKVPKWVETKKEYNDEHPQDEYQTLQEGNTLVEIDLTFSPIEVAGKFNKRMKYLLTNGKFLTVPMGLDRQIIDKLANGENKFTITRIGKEKDSRYKVF